mgnify:CR=1 FL=1
MSSSAMQDIAQHLELPLEELGSTPLLRQMYDWWHKADDLPHWKDVSPFTIPRGLLPRIILVEMSRDPVRFKIRLAGTALCAEQGWELKGHYVDEIYNARDYKVIEANYLDCAKTRQPRFSERHVLCTTGNWVVYRVLILPLRDDEGEVAGFLSCSAALN